MALLMSDGVAKCGAIKEILGRHGLPAVDSRIELAAAKHRVAIRLHRQIARLNSQEGFRQADIRAHHRRQILVVFLVQRVGNIGLRHV